ncbi:AAA family ATPase [Streptomyces sp. NPDC059101]|uniref:AAA family ATPase n=1 Tax=Streptomyces sp. NPDC059101 TaxID=3346728 RepID=UPI0036AADD38
MPLAILLVGLTGSGKTTVAKTLADHGYVRLSVDEEVHRLHGRYGVDYPEHTYFERERPVVEATRERFIKEIEAGHDVVLDHGLWRRSERDTRRQAAREAGGPPPRGNPPPRPGGASPLPGPGRRAADPAARPAPPGTRPDVRGLPRPRTAGRGVTRIANIIRKPPVNWAFGQLVG